MEAQACRIAIQFAVEIRLRRVVFEGDSTLVINVITQEGAKFSSYGNILMKFTALLQISSLSSSIMLVMYVIVLLMFWLKKLKTFSGSKNGWKIHLMTLFPYCFLMFINFSFQLSPRLLVWFLQKKKKKLNI